MEIMNYKLFNEKKIQKKEKKHNENNERKRKKLKGGWGVKKKETT